MHAKKNESKVEQQMASENRFGEQMDALVEFGRTHAERLALREFGPDRTEAMARALLQYKKTNKAFQAARGSIAQKRRLVTELVAESMDYRQELTVSFVLVKKHGGPLMPKVRKRTSFGRISQRCLVWMDQVRTDIELLSGLLSPFMGDPLGRLDQLQARLSAAVLSQQQAKAELASRRQALLDSRSEVWRLAEMLRLSGRLAFKGQPDLLRQVSWRAGQHHRRQATPPVVLSAKAA